MELRGKDTKDFVIYNRKMQKISPIKERILKFADTLDISRREFYKKTGISRGTLESSTGITEDTLAKFIAAFGELSPEWILTGNGEMYRHTHTHPASQKLGNQGKDTKDFSTNDTNFINIDTPVAQRTTEPGAGIPLIPIDAVAGLPVGESLAARFIDCAHYVIPEFVNLNVEYMIRVSGSSMYPKYSNGDILACRRVQDVLFFQWGKIYVIDSSQGALVKRVFQDEDPDRILLVSDNREHYPPFSIPKSDIRSLSIVVGVIRLE